MITYRSHNLLRVKCQTYLVSSAVGALCSELQYAELFSIFFFLPLVRGIIYKFRRICVLAFHKALVDQPWDPFVVSAFGYAVHGHGNLHEAVKFGKTNSRHEQGFPENITLKRIPPSIAVKIGVINLAASVSTTLSKMALANERYASQAMIDHTPNVWAHNLSSILHFLGKCVKV